MRTDRSRNERSYRYPDTSGGGIQAGPETGLLETDRKAEVFDHDGNPGFGGHFSVSISPHVRHCRRVQKLLNWPGNTGISLGGLEMVQAVFL